MSAQLRRKIGLPPNHIGIKLGQMSVDNLRKVLRRYDAEVDNGTYSRKIGGAVVAVTLCSYPERLIPENIKREKPKNFAVTIAKNGGFPESVILAPRPGAQVFDIWKASQDCWESQDQVLRTRNEDTSDSDDRLPSSSDYEPGSQTDETYSDLATQDIDTVIVQSQDEDGDHLCYGTAIASASPARQIGRDKLPEHIRARRSQAAEHVRRQLLVSQSTSATHTRQGNTVSWRIIETNEPLTVRLCSCPADLIPKELRRKSRNSILVASGQCLEEAKAIGGEGGEDEIDARVYHFWNGGDMPEFEEGCEIRKRFVKDSRNNKRPRAESPELTGTPKNPKDRKRDSVSSKRRQAAIVHPRQVEPFASVRLASKRSLPSKDTEQLPSNELAFRLPSGSSRMTQEAGSPSVRAAMHSRLLSDLAPESQLDTLPSTVAGVTRDAAGEGPNARLLTEDQRRRVEFCFVRTTSDVTQKFPLDPGANTIKRFFMLAEIARTMEPYQELATLSASIPDVSEPQEIALFANWGYDEMLSAIAQSMFWQVAGDQDICMIKVRAFRH